MNSNTSYAIVQIQATQFTKGEHTAFALLENMIPSHSMWEELAHEYKRLNDPDEIIFLHGDDTEFLADCVGLEFNSLGDWPSGYWSFFDHEKEMLGIEELIDPYRESIMGAVNASLAKTSGNIVSITTLWSNYSYQDYDGEWDGSIEYHGVFELKDVIKLIA